MVVGERVTGNSEQPGSGVLQVTELLPFAHGFEKHVLQNIIGHRRLFHLADKKTAKLRLVVMPGL